MRRSSFARRTRRIWRKGSRPSADADTAPPAAAPASTRTDVQRAIRGPRAWHGLTRGSIKEKTPEGTTPGGGEASPISTLSANLRNRQDATILVFSEVPLPCRTVVLLSLAVLSGPMLGAQEAATPVTASPSPDPARSNTLRWTTKGGATNFAYEVFRAESEGGPFTKVNREFISGHLTYRGQQVQR